MKTTAIRAILEWAGRGDAPPELSEAMAEVETIETMEALGQRRAACVGLRGRCGTHDKPLGADLQCEVGRGGPLVLPEPTAQQRKKRR